jgi:hypothetical protein
MSLADRALVAGATSGGGADYASTSSSGTSEDRHTTEK